MMPQQRFFDIFLVRRYKWISRCLQLFEIGYVSSWVMPLQIFFDKITYLASYLSYLDPRLWFLKSKFNTIKKVSYFNEGLKSEIDCECCFFYITWRYLWMTPNTNFLFWDDVDCNWTDIWMSCIHWLLLKWNINKHINS